LGTGMTVLPQRILLDVACKDVLEPMKAHLKDEVRQ
jgi:hypothetical protein